MSMNMATSGVIVMLARLGIGAIATFMAILVWSSTRDTAWMFVVMGTVLRYGEIMYTTFQDFGIAPPDPLFFGIPAVRLLLDNLPTILYAVAFAVVLARGRIR
jgi:hypothetical protein